MIEVREPSEAARLYAALFGYASNLEGRFRLANTALQLTGGAIDQIAECTLEINDGVGVRIGRTTSAEASDVGEGLAIKLLPKTAVEVSSFATDAVFGIDHLVVRSRDVDATRAFYEGLGLRVLFDREFPDWKVRLCMCRIGDAVIEIAGRLGAEDESEEDDAPRDLLWGITWRVQDLEAGRRRLVDAGVEVSEVRAGRRPGTRVATVRSHTCGVPTLLIEPAATAN